MWSSFSNSNALNKDITLFKTVLKTDLTLVYEIPQIFYKLTKKTPTDEEKLDI